MAPVCFQFSLFLPVFRASHHADRDLGIVGDVQSAHVVGDDDAFLVVTTVEALHEFVDEFV